jgi:hypothetical protein
MRRVHQRKPKASRLTPCPPKLKAIIDLANSVPPDQPVPNLAERFYERAVEPSLTSPKQYVEWERRNARLLLAEQKNRLIRESRDNLRMIAHRTQLDLKRLADVQRQSPLQTAAIIEIEQGKITITGWLIEALKDVKDAARIRQCEICQRIFWAGRSDQQCCSPECSRARRNRTYQRRLRRKIARSKKG